MKTVRVRRHQAHRRVGEIDGVEVHSPPLDLETVLGIPEKAVLLSREDVGTLGTVSEVFRKNAGVFAVREGRNLSGLLVGECGLQSPTAFIRSVETYTEHAERRRGVGKRLVRAFEVWARDRGAKRVELMSMVTAEGFWENMGYTRREGRLWEKEL